MISPNDLRRGAYIRIDKEIYMVEYFQHIKPGKGGAFIRTKLRNLRLDTVIDKTFRDAEKLEDIFVEEKRFLYMYHGADIYHFMDQETFEEIMVDKKTLGHSIDYLKDNTEIQAAVYEHHIIKVSPPLFVDLKVVSTEDGIRGDTARGGNKPAELETGIIVQVPLFIKNDEMLKIDTRTGNYVERAK